MANSWLGLPSDARTPIQWRVPLGRESIDTFALPRYRAAVMKVVGRSAGSDERPRLAAVRT
jgi:hypothetical protein